VIALLLALLTAPFQIVPPQAPGLTSIVSVASDGSQSNGISINSGLSDDGRFVVFESQATNLVPNDTNASSDVFLRDRLLGTTTRISVTSSGVQVQKGGRLPVISGDGTKAAFTSQSPFFAPGDGNMLADIIVRDLTNGSITLASVNMAGVAGNGAAGWADLSQDGRFVAFTSQAGDLVPGDDNDLFDAFVRDMQSGVTERISVATDGTQADAPTVDISITPDGRFVAFTSIATNLAPGDVGAQYDIFVRDRLLGTTELISNTPIGTSGSQDSFYPAISADGRFVTFMSRSVDLVPGDDNGIADVFVKDRLTGAMELVSVGWQGEPVIEPSDYPDISADGRFVVFGSLADNLIEPPPAGVGDHHEDHEIFLRDRLLGTTQQVSLTPDGEQADSGSINPIMTPDGTFISFDTYATDIAAGAQDTNLSTDVVVCTLSPWTFEGGGLAGSQGIPQLEGKGLLVPLTQGELKLTGGQPFAATILFVALQGAQVNFKGGVLVAFPFIAEVPLVTDNEGELALPFTWPQGVPAGTTLFFQALLQDLASAQGLSLSTAVAAVTP
jgi:Tol biopolymer transport system component